MPPLPAALAAAGIGLRAREPGDRPFLRLLYGLHRAAELAAVPWPASAKAAFLDDQFRLQAAHLALNHADADLLIVTRAAPPGPARPIGRLDIDRSAAWWRLLEIALMPAERGGGLGAALIAWAQGAARAADAAGIDLHVTHDNPRAAALYARLGFRARPGATATHLPMRWRRGGRGS